MSALLLWWESRFGSGFRAPHGVWFRLDGYAPLRIIWGPSYPGLNGWWIWPYGDVREHLVSFTALTFPA